MSDELFRTHVHVKTIDQEARTVEYIASTESVDSYGDIVEQDWSFDRFEKNPAILYGHNRHANGGWFDSPFDPKLSFPIGRAIEWGVIGRGKSRQLRIKVEFATRELNEFADDVFRNVAAGFLNAGSVGFDPHDVRREKHEDVDRYVLSQNELYEFSPCPLGANPDAVTLEHGTKEQVEKLLERRNIHRALLQELAARSTPTTEPDMDPKELEAQLTKANAEVEALRSELQAKTDELTAKQDAHAAELQVAHDKVKELEGSLADANGKLAESEKAVTTEKERADKLEDSLVNLEVDGYVGTKLAPAERDTAIRDRRREGSKAFSERMSARPDLNLTTETTPAEKVHTTTAATNDKAGTKLAEGMRAVEHKA